MKKSQVLAALALAFALGLGVVAPVANTYAYVYEPSNPTGVEEVTNGINDALKEAAKVSGYSVYSAMINDIIDTQDAIADAKKAQASALYTQLTTYEMSVTSGDSTTDEILKVPNVNKTDSYDTLVNKATTYQQQQVNYYQSFEGKDTSTLTAEQQKAIALAKATDNAIKGLLSNAQNAVNDAITVSDTEAAVKGALGDEVVEALTDTESYKAKDAAAQFDALVALAKKAEKYNYFYALVNAVNEATEVIATGADAKSYNVADATAALNTLNAAIEGKVVPTDPGTNQPGDGAGDGEEGKNPTVSPDTGVLASAEGSASTTVAMVAGLATALTAAGAGVVAYRNARRSTRK